MFSVKNVRMGHQGLEYRGWECSLYFHKMKVATCVDRGDGGPVDIHWGCPEVAEDFAAHIATLPPDMTFSKPLPVNADMYVESLIKEFELDKKYRRMCRTKVVLQMHDDPDGTVLEFKCAYTAANMAQIKARYPNIKEVINARYYTMG